MFKQLALSAALLLGLTATASAQVTEIRLGANAHDIDWSGLGAGSDKERSGALNGEIVFAEPEFLKWALTPQPYIGGALNLGGRTSYGGGGLLWRQTLGERFYVDFSFGLVVHDGTLETEPSALVQSILDGTVDPATFSDAERLQFLTDVQDLRFRQQNNIDFGSRVLFREQLALGVRWSEDWSSHVFIEHLSHGKILAPNSPNEGLDTMGFRVSRHF